MVEDAKKTFSEVVTDRDAFCHAWAEMLLRHRRMLALFSITNTVILKDASSEMHRRFRLETSRASGELTALVRKLFPEFTNIEVKIAKPEAVEKREGRMVLITDQGEVISDGIFLLRESVAPDKLVPGLEMDGSHVKVDRKMASNLPGLFAAGDITGTPYQYIKAAGEGNVAALSAVAYIDNLK